MLLPNGADAGQAASGTFADVDEIEHFNEVGIAGVGYAAGKGFLQIDAEGTGVGDFDLIRPLLHHKAAAVVIVRVDKGVCQSFPDGLMERGVVDPVDAGKLERHFQIPHQPGIDLKEEIVEVAAPVAGVGNQPVRPAVLGVLRPIVLLIIQKIIGKLPHDLVFVAEHQKPGGSGAEHTLFVACHCADPVQKFPGFEVRPNVTGAQRLHPAAVSLDGVRRKNIHGHVLHDAGILRDLGLIAHHGTDFFPGTMVVAFTVPTVGAGKRISTDIDGLVLPVCPGNFNDDDPVAAAFYDLDVAL